MSQITNSLSEGRQRSAWHLIAAFVVAGALCSIITTLLAVYVLGWFDPKFQNALNSALQVGLLDTGLSLAVASVVFAVAVAICARRGKGGSRKLAALLGGLYPVGFVLLGRIVMQWDSESLIGMVIGIGYIVLYSAIAGLATSRAS